MARVKKGLIVVVGHEKGGVGKSTAAVNLGYALKATGEDVAVVDTDTTQTSASWGAIREEEGREPRVPVIQATASPLATIKELVDKYDVIVVDVGARDYGKYDAIARYCDLWVIPTQVGQADLESTVRLVKTIEAFDPQHKHGKVPAVCVFNRTPISHNSPEERIAREDLAAACPGLKILNASLKDRKVYRDAGRTGSSVFELPKRDSDRAVAEFSAFVSEAMKYVSKAKTTEVA